MKTGNSGGCIIALAAAVCGMMGLAAQADIILDNGDRGTWSSGTWEVSSGTKPYGKNSLWARDGATYTWAFTGQPSGTYEVLMWWSGWSSRASVVNVAIVCASGTEAVVINQQAGAGQWNSLGMYEFGSSGSVTVKAAYGATVSTCADAVWFRRHTGDAKPIAHIKSISPQAPAVGQTVSFSGSGDDLEGKIVQYYWISSIDGVLSNSASFSTKSLSAGTHEIAFAVQDEAGQWGWVTTSLKVGGGSSGGGSSSGGSGGGGSSGGSSPPKVNFYAERFRGGAPFSVQFRDQSTGDISQWRWDFGDGQTSSQRNPSHTYTKGGLYTVKLTVTGPGGTATKKRLDYIDIKPTTHETIYLVDGYAGNNYFLTDLKGVMWKLGATETSYGWQYKPSNSNMTYTLRKIQTVAGAVKALKEENAHVVLVGHANFGFGMVFVNAAELWSQKVDEIRYVDDDRFVRYGTEFIAATAENVMYEAAYPNWRPRFKDGRSALAPYDFGDSRGNPPYNYYLTYQIPGDPTHYRIEWADGSYVQRFPGIGVPAWYSATGAKPDPAKHPQYFIRNTDTQYNRFDCNGDWVIRNAGTGYTGPNYQVQWRGSGSKVAKWTIVVNSAGQYQVAATWPALSSNASNAKYTIRHANGYTVVRANQRSGSGRHWLGSFYFNKGPAVVELNDDADGQVIADAIILKGSSGEIYTDNTFLYKPHIKSSSGLGRVICYGGEGRIKPTDVKYARLFHSSCKSLEHFGGTLHRGVMYAKRDNVKVEHDTAVPYLDYYLRGYTDKDILDHVNRYENIHEFFNFNEKPPSMR